MLPTIEFGSSSKCKFTSIYFSTSGATRSSLCAVLSVFVSQIPRSWTSFPFLLSSSLSWHYETIIEPISRLSFQNQFNWHSTYRLIPCFYFILRPLQTPFLFHDQFIHPKIHTFPVEQSVLIFAFFVVGYNSAFPVRHCLYTSDCSAFWFAFPVNPF